jgi:hypothetical protein
VDPGSELLKYQGTANIDPEGDMNRLDAQFGVDGPLPGLAELLAGEGEFAIPEVPQWGDMPSFGYNSGAAGMSFGSGAGAGAAATPTGIDTPDGSLDLASVIAGMREGAPGVSSPSMSSLLAQLGPALPSQHTEMPVWQDPTPKKRRVSASGYGPSISLPKLNIRTSW